ncbi:MAG: site-2 protease family protein [Thermoplasmatota archaeon]
MATRRLMQTGRVEQAMAASGWFIFLALAVLYLVVLSWLAQSGRMQRWNLTFLLGFIIMVRTQRGRALLDVLARPRRLWNAFADVGTALTFVGMGLMTLLVGYSLWVVLQPNSPAPKLGITEILVIPGVNPFVPLWYGIAALAITLAVHEGGHGILARANDMRVKSLGLLFAIVPIGAFVEPDETELAAASRRRRLRVFSVGPAVNVAVAVLCLVAFAGAMGTTTPRSGVYVRGMVEGPAGAPTAAQSAGIVGGDIITAMDGKTVTDYANFTAIMAAHSPGERVVITLQGKPAVPTVLGNRWAALTDADKQAVESATPRGDAVCANASVAQRGGACAEALQVLPFLGIDAYLPNALNPYVRPLGTQCHSVPGPWLACHLIGVAVLAALPFNELAGDPVLSTYLPHFRAVPGPPALFWTGTTLLFWIFWMNLMVGVTNILPMIPLDGGHIFRDGVGGLMARLRPRMDSERRDRMVARTAVVVSLVLLGAVVAQFALPWILPLLHQ